MKKIGIMTFHYADNYGAVLQAFALRQCINTLPGCKAELINYVPIEYSYKPYEYGLYGQMKLIEKRHKFDEFLTKNVVLILII